MITLGGNWTHLIPERSTPLRAAAPRGGDYHIRSCLIEKRGITNTQRGRWIRIRICSIVNH